MKANQQDICDYTVYIVGLSGTLDSKGVCGIGKSYICQKITQPNNDFRRDLSIVSKMDFYGPVINRTHWIYWGSVTTFLNGKKYHMNFIEKTSFLDDKTYYPFCNSESSDYVKRSLSCEIKNTKQMYKGHYSGGDINNCIVISEKNCTPNIVMLLYDVSSVDKRDYHQQDQMFRSLFDNCISQKIPVVVVATKYDEKDTTILDRLVKIVEKKPYSRYPIVYSSVMTDVNIYILPEVLLNVILNGAKHEKQKDFTYESALIRKNQLLNELMIDIRKIVKEAPLNWADVKPKLDGYINKLGIGVCQQTFENIKKEIVSNRHKAKKSLIKEELRKLLSEFEYIFDYNAKVEKYSQMLCNNQSFLAHFVPFNEEMEYFEFKSNLKSAGAGNGDRNNNRIMLPLKIIDPNYENNLLFVIDNYFHQMHLEESLFRFLALDWEMYVQKSFGDIKTILKNQANFDLIDSVIMKIYEKFCDFSLKALKLKFIDIFHERSEELLSLTMIHCVDILPYKPWNNISPTDNNNSNNNFVSNGHFSLSQSSFVTDNLNEFKSKIDHPYLSNLIINKSLVDKVKFQDECIMSFLRFMLSPSPYDCIYHDLIDKACSRSEIMDVVSDLQMTVVNDCISDDGHIIRILLVTNDDQSSDYINVSASLTDVLGNHQGFNCRIHPDCKYRVHIIQHIHLNHCRRQSTSDSESNCNQEILNVIRQSLDEESAEYLCGRLCVVFVMEENICHEINQLIWSTNVADDDPLMKRHVTGKSILKFVVTGGSNWANDVTFTTFDTADGSTSTTTDNYNYNYYWSIEEPVFAGQIVLQALTSSLSISVVWVVTFCGDHDAITVSDQWKVGSTDCVDAIPFICKTLKDYCQSELVRINEDYTSIGGWWPTKQNQPFRISFLTYHQVIKMFMHPMITPTVDGMLLLSIENKMASLHTLCGGLKKLIPKYLSNKLNTLLLYFIKRTEQNGTKCDGADTKYLSNHNVDYEMIDISAIKKSNVDKMYEYFQSIMQSSFANWTREWSETQSINYSLSLESEPSAVKCKLCCEVCRNLGLSQPASNFPLSDEKNVERKGFTVPLGNVNEKTFKKITFESNFHIPQDFSSKCTKMNCDECTQEPNTVVSKQPVKPFRSRVRSQSGPDLRSEGMKYMGCFGFLNQMGTGSDIVDTSTGASIGSCMHCGRSIEPLCSNPMHGPSLLASVSGNNSNAGTVFGSRSDISPYNSHHHRRHQAQGQQNPIKKRSNKLQDFLNYLKPSEPTTAAVNINNSNSNNTGQNSQLHTDNKRVFRRSFRSNKNR